MLKLPRRWQAVYGTISRTPAKGTCTGALRFLAKNDTKTLQLTLISDERTFVRDLFLDFSFPTMSEPRVVLTGNRSRVHVAISSAGRQLLGFLAKIGTLRDAFTIIDDPFWEAVFAEMAGPLGGASVDQLADITQQLKARLRDDTEFKTQKSFVSRRRSGRCVRVSGFRGSPSATVNMGAKPHAFVNSPTAKPN